MANVAINVEVRSNGEVVLGKLGTALDTTGKKADALNAKVHGGTQRMGEFSGAAARTSMTLARSADAFGLNAGALRTLNDVMDVAEIGFQNMNKAAAGFNAASLGAAGAGLAIGTVIGNWLRDIPAVKKAADEAAKSLYNLFASQETLDKQRNATKGLKEFSASIAAINAEAIKKQAEAMRAGGASDKDLAKFYKGNNAALGVLGMTPNDLERKAEAEKKAKEYQRDILALTKEYNQALVSVVKNRRDDADALDSIDEMTRDILATTEKNDALMLAGKKEGRLRGGDMLFGDSGLWTRYQDVLDTEMEIAAQTDNVVEKSVKWYDVLQGVAAQFDTLAREGGPIGTIAGMIGGLLTSVAGLGASLETLNASKGVGGLEGLLGKISGVGGIVGSAIGIGKTLWNFGKKLFGGKSEAEKQAEREAKKAAEEKARTEAEAKRAAGLTAAQGGVSSLIDNLTYTNAAGQVVNTFSDPKVAEAAAGLFGATFWETFRRQGVQGIDALRPAWTKLHDQLVKLGFDPVKMGLGRVGQMFDITGDPKTKALLGVAQGAGQMLRGAMDAGYVDKGFVADSTTLARQTLAELQGQGLDANTAAQSMADQLTALAQAYAATGQEMPEDLRAAMEAAGLEVLPTQLEVLKESRDYLRQIAGAAGYAEGGIVRGPRLVRVGERGPEAIVPLNSGAQVTSRPVNVTIQRELGTTRETERAFDRRVERTVRRLLRTSSTVQYDARVAVVGGR